MKRLTTLLFMLCLSIAGALADNDKFTEDFESGMPTSNSSTEKSVTLSSGTWTIKSVYGKKDNNSMRATMASNGYMVTPPLVQPGKVTFYHRASGSGKQLVVEKSTDNGTTWSELGTVSVSSSTPYASSSFKVNSTEDDNAVLIRFTAKSSTIYVDDVTITLNSATTTVTEPDDPTYITEGEPIPTKAFPEAVNTWYLSPEGDDSTGDGSFDKPWFNLQYAIDRATAGDHIVLRGGTYKPTMKKDGTKYTIRITTSGTADAPIIIRSYKDEKPVIDFEQQLIDQSVGDRGILMTGDYWWLFGLTITHAADNGIKLEGSHNRIERCEFCYNLDSGIQLGFGHSFSDSHPGISSNDGSYCAYNDVIDCDSHHNCDYDSNWGSDADGFACKMHNGKGNRFIRCRSWRNSDDAWDLYETDYDVIIAECWAWESAKSADHQWPKDYIKKSSSMSFSGNGNGIKLGGNSSKGNHYVFNSIVFGCNVGSSVKGFDCNNHSGGHILHGCLAFDNSYDYMFESGGDSKNTFFYNNVCLGKQEISLGTDDYNAITTAMQKNGWSNHLLTGVTRDDFISLDEDEAIKPRAIDGSFPRKFGRLSADSQLIDQGNSSFEDADPVWQALIAEFPFLARTVSGNARDIGPYERSVTATAIPETIALPEYSAPKARKYIENGQIIIERSGVKYNVYGQRVR